MLISPLSFCVNLPQPVGDTESDARPLLSRVSRLVEWFELIGMRAYARCEQLRLLMRRYSVNSLHVCSPAQVDDDANALSTCQAHCVRGTVVNEEDLQTGGVWSGNVKLTPSTAPAVPGKLNCYCELYTWCPDENVPKVAPDNAFVLRGLESWTISVRQNVNFKSFDIVTTNSQPKSSTLPPIYTLEQILAAAGESFSNQTREHGGIVAMDSQWNCNLDWDLDDCNPKVDWIRLSSSYNFRRVEFNDGIFSGRQLIKQFGIRIVVILSGSAGKFDIAALLTNIGQRNATQTQLHMHSDTAIRDFLAHRLGCCLRSLFVQAPASVCSPWLPSPPISSPCTCWAIERRMLQPSTSTWKSRKRDGRAQSPPGGAQPRLDRYRR